MKRDIALRMRFCLIEVGKIIPFAVCAIIMITYFEDIWSLFLHRYIAFGKVVCLYKPISWNLADFFEYEVPTSILITIISFAIETCIYNKIACGYIFANLYEKSFFETHVFNEKTYYLISIINILICAFLCYKGIKRTIKWA